MGVLTTVDQQDDPSEKLNIDQNGNAIEITSDHEYVNEKRIVASDDNWIARFFYGGPIGMTVNICLLISWTLYFALTIQSKLDDDVYKASVVDDVQIPFISQLFIYLLPIDLLMMTLIICLLYPLSRLSRSTPYYWITGIICSLLMFAMTCFDLETPILPIRTLMVTDATRLSMKVYAFLFECKKSEEVFKRSSAKSLLYYLLIPHLIYRHEYPRAESIRWVKVFCHIWWLLVGLFPVAGLTIQFCVWAKMDLMTVTNSEFIWKTMVIALVICLSYPIFIWLFLFENLNGLLGELLRFPDLRLFDVKNLFNGGQIASEGNRIASQWFSRYLFIPTIKATGSRFKALFCVIGVSFIFHEIVFIYTLHLAVIPAFFTVVIVGPIVLSVRVKNKLSALLICIIIVIVMLFYAVSYPYEYFAWKYSSMQGLEKESKIRLIPLYIKQLAMRSTR